MTRSPRFAWVQEAPRRASRARSPSSDSPNIRRAGREVNDPREFIDLRRHSGGGQIGVVAAVPRPPWPPRPA
jgi:hypothetical protein